MTTYYACKSCQHYKSWEPTDGMRHPQMGNCVNPKKWGEGGMRLVRDDDVHRDEFRMEAAQ